MLVPTTAAKHGARPESRTRGGKNDPGGSGDLSDSHRDGQLLVVTGNYLLVVMGNYLLVVMGNYLLVVRAICWS